MITPSSKAIEIAAEYNGYLYLEDGKTRIKSTDQDAIKRYRDEKKVNLRIVKVIRDDQGNYKLPDNSMVFLRSDGMWENNSNKLILRNDKNYENIVNLHSAIKVINKHEKNSKQIIIPKPKRKDTPLDQALQERDVRMRARQLNNSKKRLGNSRVTVNGQQDNDLEYLRYTPFVSSYSGQYTPGVLDDVNPGNNNSSVAESNSSTPTNNNSNNTSNLSSQDVDYEFTYDGTPLSTEPTETTVTTTTRKPKTYEAPYTILNKRRFKDMRIRNFEELIDYLLYDPKSEFSKAFMNMLLYNMDEGLLERWDGLESIYRYIERNKKPIESILHIKGRYGNGWLGTNGDLLDMVNYINKFSYIVNRQQMRDVPIDGYTPYNIPTYGMSAPPPRPTRMIVTAGPIPNVTTPPTVIPQNNLDVVEQQNNLTVSEPIVPAVEPVVQQQTTVEQPEPVVVTPNNQAIITVKTEDQQPTVQKPQVDLSLIDERNNLFNKLITDQRRRYGVVPQSLPDELEGKKKKRRKKDKDDLPPSAAQLHREWMQQLDSAPVIITPVPEQQTVTPEQVVPVELTTVVEPTQPIVEPEQPKKKGIITVNGKPVSINDENEGPISELPTYNFSRKPVVEQLLVTPVTELPIVESGPTMEQVQDTLEPIVLKPIVLRSGRTLPITIHNLFRDLFRWPEEVIPWYDNKRQEVITVNSKVMKPSLLESTISPPRIREITQLDLPKETPVEIPIKTPKIVAKAPGLPEDVVITPLPGELRPIKRMEVPIREFNPEELRARINEPKINTEIPNINIPSITIKALQPPSINEELKGKIQPLKPIMDIPALESVTNIPVYDEESENEYNRMVEQSNTSNKQYFKEAEAQSKEWKKNLKNKIKILKKSEKEKQKEAQMAAQLDSRRIAAEEKEKARQEKLKNEEIIQQEKQRNAELKQQEKAKRREEKQQRKASKIKIKNKDEEEVGPLPYPEARRRRMVEPRTLLEVDEEQKTKEYYETVGRPPVAYAKRNGTPLTRELVLGKEEEPSQIKINSQPKDNTLLETKQETKQEESNKSQVVTINGDRYYLPSGWKLLSSGEILDDKGNKYPINDKKTIDMLNNIFKKHDVFMETEGFFEYQEGGNIKKNKKIKIRPNIFDEPRPNTDVPGEMPSSEFEKLERKRKRINDRKKLIEKDIQDNKTRRYMTDPGRMMDEYYGVKIAQEGDKIEKTNQEKKEQEEFVKFLIEKSGAKTQKELEAFVKKQGEKGIEKLYQEFKEKKKVKARHGVKLNYINYLKGGSQFKYLSNNVNKLGYDNLVTPNSDDFIPFLYYPISDDLNYLYSGYLYEPSNYKINWGSTRYPVPPLYSPLKQKKDKTDSNKINETNK